MDILVIELAKVIVAGRVDDPPKDLNQTASTKRGGEHPDAGTRLYLNVAYRLAAERSHHIAPAPGAGHPRRADAKCAAAMQSKRIDMPARTRPRFAIRDIAWWLAVGNVVLALVATFVFVKWRGESQEVGQLRAREAVTTVARALAQGVYDDMVRIDGVLKSAVAAFERASGQGLSENSRLAAVLTDLRVGLPDVDVLLMCDVDGNVRLGLAKGAPSVNLADRDFFVAARTAAPSALPVVSTPWMDRVSGKWGISIARSLRTPEGRFVGTVHATLGSDYFARRLGSVPLGQDGVIALRTSDMSLIARITPDGASNVGLGSAGVSATLKGAVASRPADGNFVSRSPRDGVERAVAYQRVADFPLYVIVGQGVGDMIADASEWARQWLRRLGAGPDDRPLRAEAVLPSSTMRVLPRASGSAV